MFNNSCEKVNLIFQNFALILTISYIIIGKILI